MFYNYNPAQKGFILYNKKNNTKREVGDEYKCIVSSASYSLQITQHNGTYRNVLWSQSNWFINGRASAPSGITVVGGKTGTTDEAGSCLMMLFKDETDTPYIAVIMGAANRTVLYENMKSLLKTTL